MNIVTDMEKIKEIAKGLLHIRIRETELSPMIVSHPFFQSGYLASQDKKIVNILEDKEGYAYILKQYERLIDLQGSYIRFAVIITKPYRLLFYKMTKEYASEVDAGKFLRYAWQHTEGANAAVNMTLAEMRKWFKEIRPEYLMTDEEREQLDTLPETITIYRGLSDKQAKIKALSWTLSIRTARWFADREQRSEGVYRAEIEKKFILAYFDDNDEQEIICDYSKLRNIRKIEA